MSVAAARRVPWDDDRHKLVDEVAEHFRVSTATVYRALAGGQFPGARQLQPGRAKSSWRIPKEAAEAWFDGVPYDPSPNAKPEAGLT